MTIMVPSMPMVAGHRSMPPLAPHPRLRLSDARVAEINALVATDTVAARMLTSITAAGTRLLTAPMLTCNISGPGGLLGVASGAVNRMYTLGLLYRLSGNTSWSLRAIEEMRAIANFSTWHPPHFLDTAEMSHAMSIGYDWLHAELSDADKRAVEAAVLKLGIGEYNSKTSNGAQNVWARGDWNWNQVVNGGMAVASLTFADATATAGLPEAAATAFSTATSALRLAFASYAPGGAWPEGAGYWGYGTRYVASCCAGTRRRHQCRTPCLFDTVLCCPISCDCCVAPAACRSA